MKDYYTILGVDRAASVEDIKRAYRKLAHQHHPDKNGGDDKKFKEINEAYQVLSNQEKRVQYDRFGRTFDGQGGSPFGQGGNPFGGGFEFGFDPRAFDEMGGLNDIFDMFFESMGVKRRKTYERGADKELAIELTLEEAFKGATKAMAIETFVACDTCKGRGSDASAGVEKCEMCDGRGEIRENKSTFFGNFTQVRACAKCRATGEISKKICAACKGEGRVRGKREVSFKVVPGIADGQIVKLSGVGDAGERGGGQGDVYVRIRVAPHPVFQRRGNDLVVKKAVKITDILLGKKIDVPTLSGKEVKIVLPGGFRLGDQVRVSGEGMPVFGTLQRGNLYVILDITTPKKLSSKAKTLLEELDGEL